jgi:hypothetical protein
LQIDLAREVPEAMKPRKIPIGTSAARQDNQPTIEHKAA